MRTRPWIELLIVAILLGSMAAVIFWSGSRASSDEVSTVAPLAEPQVERTLDLEMRFAEEVEFVKVEQRVGDSWLLVMNLEKPGAMVFELLALEGDGPLKVSLEWPVQVGESVAEVKLGFSGRDPVSHVLWGEGSHQQLIELPEFGNELNP